MRVILDVSANNAHPIDWTRVKAAGVDGVFLKATEGTTYVSPDFGRDYFDALGAGLQVGAYHFWHPEQDGQAQRGWFAQHYGPRSGDLPPAWDAEINPSGRSWGDLAGELRQTLAWLAATYGDAWLYVNRSWNDALDRAGGVPGHGIWLAQGVAATRSVCMQFTPTTVPGISGPVDWSLM